MSFSERSVRKVENCEARCKSLEIMRNWCEIRLGSFRERYGLSERSFRALKIGRRVEKALKSFEIIVKSV